MASAKIPHWLELCAAFAAIYLIWGSTYVAIRFAEHGVPPFLMAGTRYTTAASLMLAWALASRKPIRMTAAQWRASAVLGALLLLCGNGGVVIAEMTIPSGLVSLIVAIVPILVALLCWLGPDKHRPTVGMVFGLLLGFAGIVLLIGPGSLVGGQPIDLRGALCVIASSLAWAIGSVYTRHLDLPESKSLACAGQMLCGGAMMFAVSILLGEPARFQLQHIDWRAVAALGYLIVFGSIIAYTAYTWLINTVSPQRVATYAYVNPIVAVFLGWSLAGEPVSERTLFAAVMIIGAVALVNSSRGRAVQSLQPRMVELVAAAEPAD
jgi:drug/metabolite transporter (DMT)-like permease